MKIRDFFLDMVYGYVIGVAMLIPGVSGGTIAVILGIYDQLLASVANLFKRFKQSFVFLSLVATGGLLGFISMARMVSLLLKSAKFSVTFFFMGVIVGSIIVMLFNRDTTKFSIKFPMLMLGASIVILIRFIPADLISYSGASLWVKFFIMIVAGLLLGGALILPGISFSMTLMTLGLYEPFLISVNEFDVHFLFPIVFATCFGTIVLSKFLSNCMTKYTDNCQSVIIGFVIASLGEMFPGIPQGNEIYVCLLLMIIGMFLSAGFTLIMKCKSANK